MPKISILRCLPGPLILPLALPGQSFLLRALLAQPQWLSLQKPSRHTCMRGRRCLQVKGKRRDVSSTLKMSRRHCLGRPRKSIIAARSILQYMKGVSVASVPILNQSKHRRKSQIFRLCVARKVFCGCWEKVDIRRALEDRFSRCLINLLSLVSGKVIITRLDVFYHLSIALDNVKLLKVDDTIWPSQNLGTCSPPELDSYRVLSPWLPPLSYTHLAKRLAPVDFGSSEDSPWTPVKPVVCLGRIWIRNFGPGPPLGPRGALGLRDLGHVSWHWSVFVGIHRFQ